MPIKTFVRDLCFDTVITDIKRLMVEKPTLFLATFKEELSKINQLHFKEARLVLVHPKLKTSRLILLHVGLSIDLLVDGLLGCTPIFQEFNAKITLDYYLTFSEKDFELLYVGATSEIKDNYDCKQSLRQDLIPYISSDHYDDEARQFLLDVYPETLDTPMPVDAFEVANRLNLTIRSTNFKDCPQILGRTYFQSTQDKNFGSVDERTVLYDTNHGNSGRLNNTIIHECFHWYKHRHYFSLKRLLASKDSSGQDSQSIYWIEKQARMIAPRILMPKEMFIKKANQLISEKQISSDLSYLNIIEEIITDLANFFEVSRQSAKIRLVECGYTEARGVMEYVDGCYLPAYAYGDYQLKNNQTFSISFEDLERLMSTDSSFRAVMKSGFYIYIEAHLVINSPKYICKNAKGQLSLTDYARYHLNECALLFEYHRLVNSTREISYQDFVLNRDQFSNISFQLVYQNGYENSSKEKQEAILLSQLEEEDNIYNQLSNDFVASMAVVKKWRQVTIKDIAREIHYEERQVRRLFKGEGSLELFILVSTYLNLPPSISGHLIEKSRWKLDLSNPIHRRYQIVLYNLRGQSVSQVREFLAKFQIMI